MKTNVFFKWIVALFTFLSLATAQGVNEYGMLPCPDGTSNCPPAGYGAPRGDLIKTKDVTNNIVYYQTNLSFSPEVGSYSSFTGNPLDNNGFSSLVYGDYSITGNTIMDFDSKRDLDNSRSKMINQLGDTKYFNSSKASLYLPDSIKPEYIKYATLTWVGSIHKNNLTGQVNKQSLVYSCADEGNIVVRKQDKVNIDHQDLMDACLNSKFKNDVSCDEVRYKIKDGIYYPNPTTNDNSFNLKNYYKNITYNPNANVNNNFQFACLEPGRQKMRKVDLKLIDDDVIKNCKDKYNNDKKCNDLFKVADSGYYTPISYNNQNSKLEFKCTNESYTKIKKENLNDAYYNPKMVQECKIKFPSQASQCDNIISTKYYTPTLSYSIDRAEIGDGVSRVKTALKSQPFYTVEELRKICVESGNKKEYCDGIDENFNGGIRTFYKLVDFSECFENKKFNYDKCYYGNGIDSFHGRPAIKIQSIKVTLGDSHCTNNPNDCEEVKTCGNYTFSGGNIDIDDYCSKNPESCSEVNTCSRYTYGSQPINLNDFCSKNPAECEKVKVCKEYNLHTISSTITPSKGDNRNLASISEKYMKDYNKMNFIAGGLEKEVFAKDDDIDYLFSYNNAQNQGGLWFVYSARADVTDFLKQAIANTKINQEGKILQFPIAGANVKATAGGVLNNSDGVSFWNNGSFIYSGARTANFGSWALTVVYDKGSIPSKSSPEYAFYKPKVVTIHNGFASLVHDLQKLDSKFLNMVFDGFYTPRQDMYDAKVSTYAVSNANYSIRFNDDEAAPFKISKYGDFSNMVNVYNILNNRHSYSGGISMVKPGAHDVEVVDDDLYKSISINTSMLNSTNKQIYMKKEQTRLKFNYGVQARSVGRTTYAEQTYPSVFAFSTDLYVPDVCYYNTVYNSAGKSSRGTGFVVREGETVKNQVYFTIADNSEAEDASGLKVKAKLSDNIIYSNDTMRIDNSLSETGPNDFIDSKLKYMLDNQKGLYEDEEHTILIPDSKDKQFNKYDGKYLSFFIGKGAGEVNGNNISGGSLNKNKKDKVYVEYKTKVGGYYEEPTFTYDFSLKGVELNYNISMAKCPSPSGKIEWENIVEVVPLDGVKVVNEDFKKKDDYDGLYTQVANEPFNVKINYDVNITGRSDDYLAKLLSDKKICILLGYTEQQCSDEAFMKGKVDEFNEKRKELSEEIQKLTLEIEEFTREITKKQGELKVVENELKKVEAEITHANNTISKLEAELAAAKAENPPISIKIDKIENDLKAAKSIKATAESKKKDLDEKKKNLVDAIKKLEGELATAQGDKGKKQTELGNIESGISDEMTRRVGRLDGKFETTLVTLKELGDRHNNCKAAKENKNIHFNYYQDFSIKEKTFKNEATKMDTIMYINKNKGSCANLKTGCFYEFSSAKAFPSFEYFTNDNDEDKIIDMKNVVVGYARPDYTFIVSYLPSGAEILTSCKQECISRYHDEPDATKDGKIEACQKVCIDKHNKRLSEGGGEIDEKYLNEYRLDICASDVFAVRPAYFKQGKAINQDKIYRLGGDELHTDFEKNIYPSDKDGNYVLGYDSLLISDDTNTTLNSDPNFAKSTVLSAIVPASCNLDEVKDIVRNADGKSISYSRDDKPIGSNILWDNKVNVSNNLRVDFRSIDKNGKDKNATERVFYNDTTKASSLSEFKKASNDKKKYADIDLGNLGKLNYYNIGYAKMRLTDLSWMKYDKPYLDKQSKSYNYKKDQNNDKFGEYIGFKEQDLNNIKSIGEYVKNKYLIPEDLVLKFRHDNVMVSVLGIKDSIIKQDPFVPGKFYTYTFFNSEPEKMGASLDINVTAASSRASVCVDKECLNNVGNYKILEIYPTLYHRGCYARDIEFGLDFTFDCNKTASDERCKSLVKNLENNASKCENQNILNSECYKPEGSENYGKLKYGLIYSVENKNGVKDGNISINNEVKVEEEDSTGKKTVTKLGEIALKAGKEGFDNARFEIPLNFNFKRFSGKHNQLNPKLIYADDFMKSENVAFEEKELSTDKTIGIGEVLTKGIIGDSRLFKRFNNEILDFDGSTTKRYKKDSNGSLTSLKDTDIVPINAASKATFYYGYINAEQIEYDAEEDEEKNVDVYSMIYYSGNVDAAKATDFAKNNLPIIDSNITAIKVNKNAKEKEGFYINRFEYYNSANDVASNKFVTGYENDKVSGLTNRKAMQGINDMYERLVLSVNSDGAYEIVKVRVSPWFVYSEESVTYNNDFNIFKIRSQSKDIANWGGTGKVKDGDIVGRYLDNDGNASKGRFKNLDTLDSAISW